MEHHDQGNLMKKEVTYDYIWMDADPSRQGSTEAGGRNNMLNTHTLSHRHEAKREPPGRRQGFLVSESASSDIILPSRQLF